MDGRVIAVSRDGRHRFGKPVCPSIRLIAGLGVEGDAHAGLTVQHLSRMAKSPREPNLRQVHLIHAELLDELAAKGFAAAPVELGENVTTRGVDLFALPLGARLRLGRDALIEVTGIRNPCRQIDDHITPGAMAATLDRAPDGALVRKAGVMAVVIEGGEVLTGDIISVAWMPEQRVALEPV